MSAEIEAIQKVIMLIHKNIDTNPAVTCHIDWVQVGERYRWHKANNSEGFGPIALFTQACSEMYPDIDMHAIRRLPEFTVIVNEFTAHSTARTSTEVGANHISIASNSTSPPPMTVVQNLNKMEEKTMENANANVNVNNTLEGLVASQSEWVKLEDGKDTYLRFKGPYKVQDKTMTGPDGKPQLDPQGNPVSRKEVTFEVDQVSMGGKVLRPNLKFSTTALTKVVAPITKFKGENGGKLEGLMVRITRSGKGMSTSYTVVKHVLEEG